MKVNKSAVRCVLEGTLIGAAGMIPGASGGMLAVAFGGMYDELPMTGVQRPIRIDYAAYKLETFSFHR